MNNKSMQKKIPIGIYDRVSNIGKLFKVPTTKAFIIQDKFLMGDFKVKKTKRRKNKKTFELEFDL